jgi:hypothetical protein
VSFQLSSPAKAGDPVRRGLSVQSLTPLEYWVARSSRAMTAMYDDRQAVSFSRRESPELCKFVVPLNCRGCRESQAPTAPAVPCAKKCAKNAHGFSYRCSQDIPAFPARWCYDFLRALPGEAAFLAPVAGGILPANVAPGSRRQDHTTSPYAASVSSDAEASDANSVHRIPCPTYRDDRETSLELGAGRGWLCP